MKLVDVNVLLYAVNSDGPNHAEARAWLERSLSGTETVAFSWLVLLAFLRLSTRVAVFPAASTVNDRFLGAVPVVVAVAAKCGRAAPGAG